MIKGVTFPPILYRYISLQSKFPPLTIKWFVKCIKKVSIRNNIECVSIQCLHWKTCLLNKLVVVAVLFCCFVVAANFVTFKCAFMQNNDGTIQIAAKSLNSKIRKLLSSGRRRDYDNVCHTNLGQCVWVKRISVQNDGWNLAKTTARRSFLSELFQLKWRTFTSIQLSLLKHFLPQVLLKSSYARLLEITNTHKSSQDNLLNYESTIVKSRQECYFYYLQKTIFILIGQTIWPLCWMIKNWLEQINHILQFRPICSSISCKGKIQIEVRGFQIFFVFGFFFILLFRFRFSAAADAAFIDVHRGVCGKGKKVKIPLFKKNLLKIQ